MLSQGDLASYFLEQLSSVIIAKENQLSPLNSLALVTPTQPPPQACASLATTVNEGERRIHQPDDS